MYWLLDSDVDNPTRERIKRSYSVIKRLYKQLIKLPGRFSSKKKDSPRSIEDILEGAFSNLPGSENLKESLRDDLTRAKQSFEKKYDRTGVEVKPKTFLTVGNIVWTWLKRKSRSKSRSNNEETIDPLLSKLADELKDISPESKDVPQEEIDEILREVIREYKKL